MATLTEDCTEQALLLGKQRSLVAVIAGPRVPPAIPLPAVVILNTGIVHRVGHNRMYVTLSRLLAARGRIVVRFDQSGIGDSAPRSDQLPPLAAGLADIREVLDSVAKSHAVANFVLIGLCAGADQAVLYGHTDPRVVGLVIMDPTIPPTPRYYLHYVLRRLRYLRSWISVLTGRSGLLQLAATHLMHRVRPKVEARPLSLNNLQFSPYLAQCYAATASRGLKVLAALTSLSPRHAYDSQLLDAFPDVSAAGTLQMQYFASADHVFSDPQDRARLFRVIIDWVGVHWTA